MRPYIITIPAPHKGPKAVEKVTIDLDHVQELIWPRIIYGPCRVPFWQWGYRLAFSSEVREIRNHFKHYQVKRVHDDLTAMTGEPEWITQPSDVDAMAAAIEDAQGLVPLGNDSVFQVNGKFYAHPEKFSTLVSELYQAQTPAMNEPFQALHTAWLEQPQQTFPPNPGPHETESINTEETGDTIQETKKQFCTCAHPLASMGAKTCATCGQPLQLQTEGE